MPGQFTMRWPHLQGPFEVHISNPNAREAWRHTSVVSPVASGTIVGLGMHGYELAVLAIVRRLAASWLECVATLERCPAHTADTGVCRATAAAIDARRVARPFCRGAFRHQLDKHPLADRLHRLKWLGSSPATTATWSLMVATAIKLRSS